MTAPDPAVQAESTGGKCRAARSPNAECRECGVAPLCERGPDAASALAVVPIGMGLVSAEGKTHAPARLLWVPVYPQPDLPVLGETRTTHYGPPKHIVVREWNVQVVLHEALHIILGGLPPGPDDEHHHRIVNAVEVGLTPLLPYLSGGRDD